MTSIRLLLTVPNLEPTVSPYRQVPGQGHHLPRPEFDLQFAADPMRAAELAQAEFFELMLVEYPAEGLRLTDRLLRLSQAAPGPLSAY